MGKVGGGTPQPALTRRLTAECHVALALALALALTLNALPQISAVHRVLSMLHSLKQYGEWEVRHGGFLGLKYLVAARSDAATLLLPVALPTLQSGLQDVDDEVRAAAADALVPVAPALLAMGPKVSKATGRQNARAHLAASQSGLIFRVVPMCFASQA